MSQLTTRVGPVEFGRYVRKCLREGYERESVYARVNEAFDQKAIDRKTVPIRALAQGMLGDNWSDTLRRHAIRVTEAVEATDASAFGNITGQLLIRLLRDEYNSPIFIGDELMDSVPEPMTEAILGTLKVPGISGILTGPSKVQPGMPYPMVQIKEDWITLPQIEKWGYRLGLTLEAMAQDRTGRIQKAAGNLGLRLRIDREERQLRVVSGMVNNFTWQDVAYNTYGSTVGPTGMTYTNEKSGVTVTGSTWSLLNAQNQLFVQMLDPFTNKPIAVNYANMKVLTVPETMGDFMVVTNASNVNTAGATTSAWAQMWGAPNSPEWQKQLLASPYLRNLLTTADASISWSAITANNVKNHWWMGDFKRAFIYRQWLEMQAFTMPPLSPDEFEKDVVLTLKCREAGAAGVMDPHYASHSFGS
jgi:hypothetical protein